MSEEYAFENAEAQEAHFTLIHDRWLNKHFRDIEKQIQEDNIKAVWKVNCKYNYKIESDGRCRSTSCMFNTDKNISTDIWINGCLKYKYVEDKYKCTICGRIGSVGRCCGNETRIKIGD